jgi:hypothetical protein
MNDFSLYFWVFWVYRIRSERRDCDINHHPTSETESYAIAMDSSNFCDEESLHRRSNTSYCSDFTCRRLIAQSLLQNEAEIS